MTYPPGEPPAPSSQPPAGPGTPEFASSPVDAGPAGPQAPASGAPTAAGPGSAAPFVTTSVPGGDGRTAAEVTAPLRGLAALVLAAANAVLLLLGVVDLVTAVFSDDFAGRADALFERFVGVLAIAAPLLAVLLATHARPMYRQARQITTAALIEYAVSALFGVICLLTGFVHQVSTGSVDSLAGVWDGFETLIARVAMGTVFAVAAFVVVRVYQALFAAPKPAPLPPYLGQPYGYPQYPQPSGYPQPPAPGHPYPGPGQYGPGQYGPGTAQPPAWYPQPNPYAPPVQQQQPTQQQPPTQQPPSPQQPPTQFGGPEHQ
ncbi:MAG TPA: hypothetical protein VF054_09445 [Micromonosporaceae bacterium]